MLRKYALVSAAVAVLLLGLVWVNAQMGLPTSNIASCLGYVSTDKPIYRVGDDVYIRTVVLDAQKHTSTTAPGYAQIAITGPKGETLANGTSTITDGVAGFKWNVQSGSTGGQYKITVSFPQEGFASSERKFDVRAYRVPRLKGEIVFLRDGFGPGDLVKASLHVERAEGGLPAGAKVTASAIVDGKSVFTGNTVIDASGNCSTQFNLPDEIATGDGTLSLSIEDGGVVEPIAKSIPILLKTVDVSFYPEGGDLIAGFTNRVYFEAQTPSLKPADIVGTLVDAQGQNVCDIRSDHEGRGRFTFVPQMGNGYGLKISQPAGIDKIIPLPLVRATGVAISSASDCVDASSPVQMQVISTTAGSYTIKLSKHDSELASEMIDLEPNRPHLVTLGAPSWADGVLTVTVRDSTGAGRAERLVFRKPAHSINVKVASDKTTYVPGDLATVTITTTDDQGKPISADVGVNATDDSVLNMLEKRDRAPGLAEMVLLESDVSELADAQSYFDPTDKDSSEKIDLLLGTQGWRRFASLDEAKFISVYKDRARRALANVQPPQAFFGARGGGFGGGGGMAFDEFAVNDANRLAVVADTASVAAPTGSAALQPQIANKLPADDFALIPPESEAKMLAGEGGRGFYRPPTDFRIFAHELRPDYHPGQRSDFTETVYWNAGVKTDDKTGSATLSFHLNDSVGSFKISADGFDSNGALGEGSAMIQSIQPFYVEPKLPLEVTVGDVIKMPIAVVNGTNAQLPVKISLESGSALKLGAIAPFDLSPSARERRISEIQIGGQGASDTIRIKALAGVFSDDITRPIIITPIGFPTEISCGGMLTPNTTISHEIDIPKSLVAGSLVAKASLYPTPLGNLTGALQGLLREPNGCFEQTSSTNYPLVMADAYFTTHTGVDPAIIAQSNALLDKGYQRLVSFECANKGYEWFGQDPGHECLSAYGLLEFTEMSAVRNVDQNMINDTRNWLMARRDGNGGFTHERRSLHTWVTDPDCANGYCTWALLETGQKGLDKEVAWLKNAAKTDTNSYVKALAANALYLAGDVEGSKFFLDQLAQKQAADGHVDGATTSVVGSEGVSLQVETTALCALAFLRQPSYAANALKAIQFLATTCQDGRYGSTQSTVLALRAIVQYDKQNAHPTMPGAVDVLVDGNSIGKSTAFSADSKGAIDLPDMSGSLTPGKHTVELKMSDGSQLPYAIDVQFHSVTPASSDQCRLGLKVSLKDAQLVEGSPTEADVTITNKSDSPVPTPIAIIGLPGGLEVRYDQLKELVKSGKIAAYETRGREVILYWRDFLANQTIEVPLSLIAAVPGEYTGPASRAYLYYSDENKTWLEGLKVKIDPK